MTSYVYCDDAEHHARRFPAACHGFDGPGMYNQETGYAIEQSQDRTVKCPTVVRDIEGFVARAHFDYPDRWKPSEITSRSKLRAYERSNNIRQAGDFKPGEIMRKRHKTREKEATTANRLAEKTGLRGPRKDFEWL